MKNLELYIHIPFCEKKCNYCDFISFHPNYDTILEYVLKLLDEIKCKKFLSNDYVISSIYIGGGTPSYIDERFINSILKCIFDNYNISSDAEISIEVNPNSATLEKLKLYYDSGINRLSIGLQSTNDNELKILGRIHNYNDFLNTYDNAICAGFNNINVDLINGIPCQTPISFKKSLEQVLILNITHISIYNLIVEDNTKLKKMLSNNEILLPKESDLLEMDKITKELTSHYKFNRYEISNYAKSGFECRHNLGYWSDVPYLGFGLNSASYINNKRYKNKIKLNDYMNLNYKNYIDVKEHYDYYETIENIDKKNHINEFLMLGFRKIEGINTKTFYNIFNENFENLFDKGLKFYQSMGLINKINDNYFLTDNGLDLSNTIISDLMLK